LQVAFIPGYSLYEHVAPSSPLDGPALMAVYDFLCLDCNEPFEVDSTKPIEGTHVRCPRCASAHVRQTFESYLRNAVEGRSAAAIDALRSCHFG
jgi:DNA-directed RNA polymerase subunit RPC12/RpoP